MNDEVDHLIQIFGSVVHVEVQDVCTGAVFAKALHPANEHILWRHQDVVDNIAILQSMADQCWWKVLTGCGVDLELTLPDEEISEILDWLVPHVIVNIEGFVSYTMDTRKLLNSSSGVPG